MFGFGDILTGVKIASGLSLGIFVFEHIGRKYNVKYRPSVMLNYVADKSKQTWELLGNAFAYASSFLTLINIGELQQTFMDIYNPTVEILLSPVWFVDGYIKRASQYVNKKSLVLAGSGLLVLLLNYLIIKYCGGYMASYETFLEKIKYMQSQLTNSIKK